MQTIDEVKKHCREVGEGIAAALTAGDVFSVKAARFVDEYADFVCRCHIRAKNKMKAGIAPRQQRRLLRLPVTPVLPFVNDIIAYFPGRRKGVNDFQESRKLAETRDALLPKLMSGELEVA